VTLRRVELTLSVERELLGPTGTPERIRLTAKFDAAGDPSVEPSTEELRAATARLREELDAIPGMDSAPGRSSRSLEELVETYRPRQAELVGLLQSDGEINAAEANLLLANLASAASGPSAPGARPPDIPPPTDRPIAAVPLELDRAPSTPRPVRELLEKYRIETLRQAGAVRSRRQISYEEYMALKRHFSVAPVAVAEPGAAAGPSEPHPANGG
jgi:Tfp pilus assembly protein PilP